MAAARSFVLRADDIEPFSHPADPGYASQHVLGKETTGTHDTLLNRGTVAPNYSLGGGNHPDNDEIYVSLTGHCPVDLGGDPDHGEGRAEGRLREGTDGFLPAGAL